MNDQPKRSLKAVFQIWIRRGLFVVAALATLVALFYAEEDWRGKRAWDKCMTESKARGFDLNWDHWMPPPVPDDQNFGVLPLFKPLFDYQYGSDGSTHWADTNEDARWRIFTMSADSEKTPELGAWQRGVPVKLTDWQAYFRGSNAPAHRHLGTKEQPIHWPKAAAPQTPAADVLLALSRFDGKIDELRQGSALRYSRFPVHYDELPKALLAHEAVLLQACQVLQLRAIAELALGRNDDAGADLRVAIYCADANRTEPFAVSILARSRSVKRNLQVVWAGLRAHRWTDGNLREIQDMLGKIDLLFDYDRSWRAEPAGVAAWILATAEQPDLYSDAAGMGHPDYEMPDFVLRAFPRGWYDQNAATCGRFFSEQIQPDVNPQTREAFPSRSKANSALMDSLPLNLFTVVFKQECAVFSPQDIVEAQTDVNLAQVACALERWRLAHGGYPDSLDLLAPDFVSSVPHDIIGGGPLKYRLKEDGRFLLYSIGWDEKDDGGTPATEPHVSGNDFYKYRPETGDWVWQYPP